MRHVDSRKGKSTLNVLVFRQHKPCPGRMAEVLYGQGIWDLDRLTWLAR